MDNWERRSNATIRMMVCCIVFILTSGLMKIFRSDNAIVILASIFIAALLVWIFSFVQYVVLFIQSRKE